MSARNSGTAGRDLVLLRHCSGTDVLAATIYMTGSFGVLQLCGTADHATVAFSDTYYAFRRQLEAFVAYVRTGVAPFPFAETNELMRLVIAGRVSREEAGREVFLEEFTQ